MHTTANLKCPYKKDRLLVLAVETVLAVSRPLQIHFLIVQFDKLLDFTQLPVIQNACILQDSIAVFLYEELGRCFFGQSAVTGVDMHSIAQWDVKYR